MHVSILGLEAAGLVERRARNQRVVLVRLTKRGRRRLEAASRRVRAVEATALGGLSRKEAQTVRGWLADLAAMNPGSRSADLDRQEAS